MLRAIILPLTTGVILVLSFPKWNFAYLAWFALIPLSLSLAQARPGQSFFRGFIALFAASLGTLYWVYPTCRAGGVNPVMSSLALFFLAAYCALYGGAFAWVTRRGEKMPRVLHPFLAALTWVSLEWLRSHLLTGFPWLLLAYSQWSVPAHLPLTTLGGPYIVSFMIVLFNGVLTKTLEAVCSRQWKPLRSLLPAFGGLLAMVLLSVGISRSYQAPEGPSVRVVLVQGNIDQYKKWDQSFENEIADQYSRLTREGVRSPVDLVVWPETSVPGWFPNTPRWVSWVRNLSQEIKSPLLIGAVTQDNGDFNAAFLVDPQGNPSGRYRKRRLVPFGETIPFQSILGKVIPVLGAMGNFDASNDTTVFAVPAGRFAVNICFESLFPGLVREFIGSGAGFTVNMTNDGWFLKTAAAQQHFAAAPFRAVENRTWFLSATNTGVTAFVSPSGEVVSRLAPDVSGCLEGTVVPDGRGTSYTRWGDVFAWGCLLLTGLFLTLSWRRDKIRG